MPCFIRARARFNPLQRKGALELFYNSSSNIYLFACSAYRQWDIKGQTKTIEEIPFDTLYKFVLLHEQFYLLLMEPFLTE